MSFYLIKFIRKINTFQEFLCPAAIRIFEKSKFKNESSVHMIFGKKKIKKT